MTIAFVGETISKTVRFTVEDIRQFATLCGDMNPLHHDADYAAESRFGGIIASGGQTVAVWFSLVATHYTAKGAMVGLSSSFQAKGPAYPDQDITLHWTVVSVEEKPRTGAEVVSLEGKVTGPDGDTIVEGAFTALLGEQL